MAFCGTGRALLALVLLAGGSPALAQSAGQSCSVVGRTQQSSVAAEGVITCDFSGVWSAQATGGLKKVAGAAPGRSGAGSSISASSIVIGGRTLDASAAATINALAAIQVLGAACSANSRIALDASGNLLVCVGSKWQRAG